MVSLLTQPGFLRRAMPVSVEAWHSMIAQGLAPERGELIRGVIVEKVSKSILHAKLVSRLLRLLQAAAGDLHWVRQEAPLTLNDSEPEPDLSVVSGREEEYDAHPTTAGLVIEVAVTTLAEDREMASLYAEAAVTEYWIINAPSRCIEAYRQPSGSAYSEVRRIETGESLSSASLPNLTVDLAALFEGLPNNS